MAKPGEFEAGQARACLNYSPTDEGFVQSAAVWALLAIYEALTEGVTIGLDNLRLFRHEGLSDG